VPETLLGHLNKNGTAVEGGIKIPGLASWLSDPATGKNTVVEGRNAFPTNSEPTVAESNVVHLAWDIMVGVATLLFLVALWYAASWIFRRRMPQSKLFLWIASACGVLAVLALEAGWVVTEVGRQPWIVHNFLTVQQGATTNGGVWITFLTILALYTALGATLIVVIRRMTRRWRATGDIDESGVPYGPTPISLEEPEAEVPVG
jgi:cytochrome d ubiquinol oxidase subunit I